MTSADGDGAAGHARLQRAASRRWPSCCPTGSSSSGPTGGSASSTPRRCASSTSADRAELIGLPVGEVLPLTDKYGRDWWAHADPWDGPRAAPATARSCSSGPRGRTCSSRRATSIAAGGGERVERVLLGLRDAEARQRAERDQATVLSTVAHELRAPLTSVTGFTSSLLRRWDRFTDEQKRLMIETIESDATRLTRLITELLDISRLDSDSLNLRLGPVDLHDLLRTHVVRHELGRATARCGCGSARPPAEQGLPEMWADADRLEQIFFNLIENALRHGGRRRHGDPRPSWRVGRRARRRRGRRHTAVRPREGLRPVLARPSNASTGLGLYVVRGLVEAHGGTVTVGANDAGGARFAVRLPAGLPDVGRAALTSLP